MSTKTSYKYCIMLTLLVCYCLHDFCIAGSNETDMLALLQIKAKISNDPLGVLSTRSWNESVHFCQWYGVTCAPRHPRVVSLKLTSSKLSGFLSPFVGNLSFLNTLDLNHNNFRGTIPLELGQLNRLQVLWLHYNAFEGHIPPSISACTSLIDIALDNNRLVGEIPSQLSSLINIQFMSLSQNHLTGTIPSWVGNFSSLIGLYILENNLVGGIPESLGKLESLKVLAVPGNRLSGLIPPSIFNLTSLSQFDVGGNLLEGTLPSNLGTSLPYLTWFDVTSNKFNGFLPNSLSNSSNLQVLELSSNHFQGHVPSLNKLVNLQVLEIFDNSFVGDLTFISSLANATNLKMLEIFNNNFRGKFPSIICNFSMLIDLQMGGNYIDGEIPSCIENLVHLDTFTADNNQLYGVIPEGIGKLVNLSLLGLNDNQLSGNIPSSIGNISMLANLILYGNKLEGHIPLTLENCGYLLNLSISNNQLSGKLPTQLFNIISLYAMDLSNNLLMGSIPEEIGQLKSLVFFDVSGNNFSGVIPNTLGDCLGLESLSMKGNYLQGPIPDGLKALKSLKRLDLSRNNLSGEIPGFLASLPLQMLDLSFNIDLEGEIPQGGIFSNSSGVSLVGNARLCGGVIELKLPECKFKAHSKKRVGHKGRIIMAVLFGVLGVVLIVALLVSLYCLHYRKTKKQRTSSEDHLKNYPNLSYHSLLKATNGFSAENLLGRGNFGVVYKGTLDDQDTSIIAIKMFDLEQHGASKSFLAECNILRNIRHRNLVKVITVCSSIDHQGTDFKAMVYEYMVNGSLEEWLHPKTNDTTPNINNAPRHLNLRHRLDVIADVASALEYLHYHCSTPIVHCDLKPSNVLLDKEMVARVSDFGLAKFLLKSSDNSHTNQPSSSLGVRGTIGYTPPEYGVGNELSTKGDVYSFGILLLEMFTGKKPTNHLLCGGISLHDYVKQALPGRVFDILDNAVIHDLDGEDINTKRVLLEAFISILEIGITCSSQLPNQRLDMRHVSKMLSSITNTLFKSQLLQIRRY
ncbi:unnamed protein product [Amaranthus hypochondriacus]